MTDRHVRFLTHSDLRRKKTNRPNKAEKITKENDSDFDTEVIPRDERKTILMLDGYGKGEEL